MTHFTRRTMLAASGATLLSGGLSSPAIAASAEKIQQRIATSLEILDQKLPQYAELVDRSAAVILIPRITTAGLFIGGAYGEGALLVQRNIVDYYSFAQANYGLQIGIQQYSSALFLRDHETLQWFKKRKGWTLGADLEFTIINEGENATLDTTTSAWDVSGLVYNKRGATFGLTLGGAKYTRITR